MSVTCTTPVEPGTDFEAHVPITKSVIDQATGKRYITGVATGIAEDRDGERMSRNAVTGMVGQVQKGGVKLTTGHQQDWWSEIGDAVHAQYDDQTDELIIKTELPPEGVDPLADKAWRTANTEQVGFSVGGKLLKSFYERNDFGKRRKVLDAVGLRHFALTKNPSYQTSFAEAVAKTWDGEAPADDEFTLTLDDVEKANTTGSFASGDSDGAGGRDSVGTGPRNAGNKKSSKRMSTEDEGRNDDEDEEQNDDLPEAKDQERHLACPNCGHEFAADLPVDPEERQLDDTKNDEDERRDTGKSLKESHMSKLSESLDELRALADGEKVEKKTDPEPETVEKTPTTENDLGDVEKLVAASHRYAAERLDGIEDGVGRGFEIVAKALTDLRSEIADLPRGRKSIARVHPSGNGTPSTAGHEADSDVEKTTEQKVDEAESATDALKAQNAAHPAYAAYH